MSPRPLPGDAEGPPPSVRPYRPWDRAACLALFDSNVPRYFHADERPGYEGWLDAPDGPMLVLDDPDGTVAAAGGVAVEADGVTGSLCWGMVRADLHGRGLGRALLTARLGLLADDPACRRVRLSTTEAVTGFFETLGFHTVRVEPDGHAQGLDAWEMELELTDGVRRALPDSP